MTLRCHLSEVSPDVTLSWGPAFLHTPQFWTEPQGLCNIRQGLQDGENVPVDNHVFAQPGPLLSVSMDTLEQMH